MFLLWPGPIASEKSSSEEITNLTGIVLLILVTLMNGVTDTGLRVEVATAPVGSIGLMVSGQMERGSPTNIRCLARYLRILRSFGCGLGGTCLGRLNPAFCKRISSSTEMNPVSCCLCCIALISSLITRRICHTRCNEG
jgi:hypothetical protein